MVMLHRYHWIHNKPSQEWLCHHRVRSLPVWVCKSAQLLSKPSCRHPTPYAPRHENHGGLWPIRRFSRPHAASKIESCNPRGWLVEF